MPSGSGGLLPKTAAVVAGPGGRTVRSSWQAQARSTTPYQDMTVSHCSSRNVTTLASWRGRQVRPGRADHPSPRTGARRTGARPTATSGSPWIGSHRGRRLDAQPAAEVLARIDVVVDGRSIDLWDRCLLAGTVDQRCPVASPDDQRAGGQVESVVWSRIRSASVMDSEQGRVRLVSWRPGWRGGRARSRSRSRCPGPSSGSSWFRRPAGGRARAGNGGRWPARRGPAGAR